MAKKQQTLYTWSTQKKAVDCEVIECPEYDDYKDFKRDPTGFYVLVRIEWDRSRMAVAVCDKDHTIVKIFRGRRAQDIYHAIFAYEKKHKVEWFKEKDHIAYLGKELKKAEAALALGVNSYFQE